MKQNVILLVDADADACAVTLEAAKASGFDVRFAQIERDLSELTQMSLDDIALIVLDYDPDVHGLAIAELLDHWQPPRPVILISSDEGLNHPLRLIGTPTRHLTKPVTVARFVHAIQALTNASAAHCLSCDRWGHPQNGQKSLSISKLQKAAA